MLLQCPRATITFGTEAPSNLNSTMAHTTVATGKWTSISEKRSSLARCLTHMSLSSGPRPGNPNLITGISMKGKRWSNLLTTKLLRGPELHHHNHQQQQLSPEFIPPVTVH